MNKQEWIELLKTDVKKWNKKKDGAFIIDLSNTNLSGADLSDANLKYANLGNTNLRCADLSDADLRGADLGNTNLRHADLRRADLRSAALGGAALGGADLRGADLRGANLSDADLGRSDLSGANLSDADLSGADLDYSCFPLWCGSFEIKTDMRLVYQLCYHVCRLNIVNKEGKVSKTGRAIQLLLMPYANKFHRTQDCGEIR